MERSDDEANKKFDEVWQDYFKRHPDRPRTTSGKYPISRRRCLPCYNQYRRVWPPDYPGDKCPMCGQPLPIMSIPF